MEPNDELNEKLARAQNVVKGMVLSSHSLTLFRDTDEVWFQLHLGLWFGLPQIVLVEKAEYKKHRVHTRLNQIGIPEDRIFKVEKFSEKEFARVMPIVEELITKL